MAATEEHILTIDSLNPLTNVYDDRFAAVSHEHAASDITSGVLPVERGGTGTADFGTYVTCEARDLSLGTAAAAAASMELGPGVWVVTAHGDFAANATGRRSVGLSTASASLTAATCTRCQAASGVSTILTYARVLRLTNGATVYLNVAQSSGSALECSAYAYAVRVA